MRSLVTGSIILILGGCTSNSPHIIEANKIIKEYSSQVKGDLILFGSGGSFNKRINEFNLDYKYYTDEMSVDQARIILLENVESLLFLVNSDVGVRPFLKEFPYTEDYLYFTIGFRNRHSFHLKGNNVSLVKVSRGEVVYSTYDEGYKDLKREPYAEAYQKVYGQLLPARGNDTECK